MTSSAVTFSRLLLVGNGPLDPAKNLRAPFRGIFDANGLDQAPVIRVGHREDDPKRRGHAAGFGLPFDSAPHIWGLGALALKTSRLGFNPMPMTEDRRLSEFLSPATRKNLTIEAPVWDDEYDWEPSFGSLPDEFDNRLSFAWLDMVRPVVGKVIIGDKWVANAQICVRVHPLGYVNLMFSYFVPRRLSPSDTSLWDMLQSLRPWLPRSRYSFHGQNRNISGTQSQVLTQVVRAVSRSLFADPSDDPTWEHQQPDWLSFFRLVAGPDTTEATYRPNAEQELNDFAEVFREKRVSAGRVVTARFGNEDSQIGGLSALISGRHQLVVLLPDKSAYNPDSYDGHSQIRDKKIASRAVRIWNLVSLEAAAVRDLSLNVEERLRVATEFLMSKDSQLLLFDRLQRLCSYDDTIEKTTRAFDIHHQRIRNRYYAFLYQTISKSTGLAGNKASLSAGIDKWKQALIQLQATRPTLRGAITELINRLPKSLLPLGS